MRVIIADDAPVLRQVYGAALRDLGVDVLAEAGTPGELLAQVRRTQPDAVLLDINFADHQGCEENSAGLDAAVTLRAGFPHLGIVVFSVRMTLAYLERITAIGDGRGLGYIGKDRIRKLQDVVDALQRTAEGGVYIDPALAGQMLTRRRVRDPISQLTDRQRDTLELAAQGHTNQAIAKRMGIAVPTVEANLTAVFRRLGIPTSNDAHKRVLAVLAWLRSAGSLPPTAA
ncbi:LuxR C-terminal-related transcriptional regulator [Streptomyces hokutonensis]|uniref:LuxR C-terminal-related transcriptional regulator n=1 Tax=Streptomyces hokutonensis TaxID=1306990 RepID=A0ABW6ME41_9ACTN